LSSARHGDGPNTKEEATSVEVLIGVDPHKATNVVTKRSTSKERWSGRRPSQQTAKDCGPWSGGQNASRSGAGPWRAQEASDARWYRSTQR
jgi:hypothetical protein